MQPPAPATAPRSTAPAGRPRRGGEEGSISILAATSMVIVLSLLALAVDLGSIVLADRDIQGAVDIAALDAVVGLGDLAAGDPTADTTSLATASMARNAGWSATDALAQTLDVEVGRYDEATRTFTPTAVAPDAVAVTATATRSRFFNFVPGNDTVRHTAVARNVGVGSVSIGTSVASIDSDRSRVLNRVLSRFFGRSSDLTLDVAGYKGLADGSVSVRRLAADLGLASPTELVDTTVSVQGLLDATIAGLSASGDPLDVAAVTPLTTLRNEVGAGLSVDLGDVLDGEVGGVGSFTDVTLNVLDLVTVVAQVVNGTNLVDLGMPISIPGVGTGNVTLTLLETPQLAFGRGGVDPVTGEWRTVARTAQARLAVDLTTTPLAGLPGGLSVGPVHLPFTVDAARGEAPLEEVVCASTGPHPVVTSPVTTGAVVTTVGRLPDPAGMVSTSAPVPAVPEDLASVQLTLPLVGSLDLGSLTAVAQHTAGSSSETLTFAGPYSASERTSGSSTLGGTPKVPSSFGDGRVGLAYAIDSATLGVTASGAVTSSLDLVADVYDPVLAAVTPIVDAVDERVVGPLVQSLGVSLGAADVTVDDVDCGVRILAQ